MLEVTDLQVRYGAIRAVRGISISVAKGELVALLGANGAGKSSTLMCIAGALKARGRLRPRRRRGTSPRPGPRQSCAAASRPCRKRATSSPT